MPSQISFELKTLPSRILLLLFAVILLAALVIVLRWCVADSAAMRVDDKEIAKMAAAWAPDDPQTHFALAALYEKGFLPDDAAGAAGAYERAAALSSSDYRYWLPLARAREHSGDIAGAESALRRALTLAPNYAQVHWALGNVLLREGRTDEAFAEMRQAIDGNAAFAVTAAGIALQFSDEGYLAILEKFGNAPAMKAAMALTLARQKKFDESLALWNSLSEEDRNISFKENGGQLSALLLAEKKFRHLVQMNSSSGQGDPAAPVIGAFTNAGFEIPIDIADIFTFNWLIAPGPQPVIGVDDKQKHSGNFSLVMIFAKGSGREFRQISQTVAVDSGASYRFRVFIRSEIKTTGALRWEIVDVNSGEVIAATKDISAENNGWEELSADLKTGAQTEGIIVRLVRSGCQNCSVEGKIWFDDLSLEKK
jgi:tetratricopeptide (TPR) repeat protein